MPAQRRRRNAPDPVAAVVAELYAQRAVAWELAVGILDAWLSAQCEQLLDGADRSRLTIAPHRIKDERRAGDKLRQRWAPDGAALTARDVETHVRDVVGMKVLCKSTRDQRMLTDLLATTPGSDGITLHDIKDYLAAPKPSGYRGVHVHVEVAVPAHDPVLVEVQIKTRLQDSWGELTHEDLYKPGAPIKASSFHSAVAATMANLLSEVDRLADHLAEELESTVTVEGEELSGSPTEPGSRTVRVRTTGPHYALAVDSDGVQGLIPAYAVRRLVGTGGYIRVHDHIRKGDELEATLVENDKGRYYLPVALADPDGDG